MYVRASALRDSAGANPADARWLRIWGCPTRGWGWCSAGAVHQHGGASRVRGLRVLGSVRGAGPEAA